MGRIFVPAYMVEIANCQNNFQPRQQLSFENLLTGILDGIIKAEGANRATTSPHSGCRRVVKCLVQPKCRQNTCRPPWIKALPVDGYLPADINVTVQDDKVIVHARREVREGDDYQKSEMKRSVKLPEDVNKDKLACYINRDGHLILKAPYTTPEKQSQCCPSAEKATSGENLVPPNTPAISKQDDVVSEGASKPDGEQTSEMKVEMKPENQTQSNPDDHEVASVVAPKLDNNKTTETLEEMKSLDQSQSKTDDAEVASLTEDIVENDASLARDTNSPTNEYTVESPVPSEEFIVIDRHDANDETNTSMEQNIEEPITTESKENLDEVSELAPLMDTTGITEVDGKPVFEVKVNLKYFQPENVSIRCENGVIYIDAKQATEEDGLLTSQEVHRQYVIPTEGRGDLAKAIMRNNGMVVVSVPMEYKEIEDKDEVELSITHNAA